MTGDKGAKSCKFIAQINDPGDSRPPINPYKCPNEHTIGNIHFTSSHMALHHVVSINTKTAVHIILTSMLVIQFSDIEDLADKS